MRVLGWRSSVRREVLLLLVELGRLLLLQKLLLLLRLLVLLLLRLLVLPHHRALVRLLDHGGVGRRGGTKAFSALRQSGWECRRHGVRGRCDGWPWGRLRNGIRRKSVNSIRFGGQGSLGHWSGGRSRGFLLVHRKIAEAVFELLLCCRNVGRGRLVKGTRMGHWPERIRRRSRGRRNFQLERRSHRAQSAAVSDGVSTRRRKKVQVRLDKLLLRRLRYLR